MKTPKFKLVPTPEFAREIERIANQYAGLNKVTISAFVETETLVIQAQYYHKDKYYRIYVNKRGAESLEKKAADLQTEFYNELVKTFEPDFIPVENF